MTRPTPRSQPYKKAKGNRTFYESGIGIFGHNDLHHSEHDGGHEHDGDD